MGSWLQQTFIACRQNTLCLAGFDHSSSATMKYALLCFTLHIKTDIKPLYLLNMLSQEQLLFIQGFLLLPHVVFVYHFTGRWLFLDVAVSFRWRPSHQYSKPQCYNLHASFWVWDLFFSNRSRNMKDLNWTERPSDTATNFKEYYITPLLLSKRHISNKTLFLHMQFLLAWCSILN